MPIPFFDHRYPFLDVSFRLILKNLTSKILFPFCFSKEFYQKKKLFPPLFPRFFHIESWKLWIADNLNCCVFLRDTCRKEQMKTHCVPRLTHIKLTWTVKNLTFVKIEFCIIFICSLRILPQQLWLLAKECNSMLILSEFLPTIGANPPKVIRNKQMKIIQNSILTNVKFNYAVLSSHSHKIDLNYFKIKFLFCRSHIASICSLRLLLCK